MIEAEAKTKWCPFVQVGTRSPFLGNGQDSGYCIGSSCMAWRWTPERGRVLGTGERVPIDGYCGLAGKPCKF